MDEQVVVITGANSGVGFMLAKRLLADAVTSRVSLTVCLACRNAGRATAARENILAYVTQHAEQQGDAELASLARVDIVQLDTSDLRSVSDAAAELMKRYPAIDRLVLNAGILPMHSIKLEGLTTFLSDLSFSGTTVMGKQSDPALPNGLQSIFCTNAFGHHCLVELLKDHLAQQSRPCRIIWTSSRSARKRNLRWDDIQGKTAIDPYSSSKICCDALSVAWHERFSSTGNVTCFTSCPGLCMSNLTASIMPQFFWYLLIPFLFMLRLMSVMMTVSLENGSEAALYLCQCPDVSRLDYRFKYVSEGRIGKTTVGKEKIPVSSDEALKLRNVVDVLFEEHRFVLVPKS